MKRLLLPLPAAVALPTTVKAENDFDSIVDKSDNVIALFFMQLKSVSSTTQNHCLV